MDDRAKSTELVRHQTIQWLRLRQRSPSFATSSMLGKNMHERGYGDNVWSGTKSSILQTPRQMSLSLMNNRQLSSATSKSTSNGLSISVNACSSAPPRNKLAVPAENNVTANRMSPEVEQKARMEAEKAIKTKKIFTIIGPYPTLRSALRQRGWVEKFQSSHRKSKSDRDEGETTETNENYSAPPEEDDEILKVMSQVVRNCTPTLVFTVKAIDVGTHATRSSQMVNHFGRSSTFTTKAGLCQNLRNVPWFTLTDPDTFYPRCYNLSDPDDRETFTDDYRLTACTGFLVYFLKKCGIDLSAGHGSVGFGTQLTAHKKYGSKTKTYFAGLTTRMALEGVLSQDEMESKNQDAVDDSASDATEVASVSNADTDDGPNDEDDESSSCVKESGETGSQSAKATRVRRVKVKQIPVIPLKALKIAIQQCRNFLKFKDNEDIDALTDKLEISDWQQFLSWYYSYIHNEMQMEEANGSLIGVCKDILQNMQRTCSQFDIDGYRDIWIMKPGAKSRGRSIQCLDKYEDIIAAVEGSECSFVVQKYIERPMLIYKTKFDIRQWFLVTDWNPLTFWFYSDCYLRFCSQEFTLENFHISVHLSNNSVQKHFSPSETRSRHIPEDNMWTSDEFQEYLKRNGYGRVWTEHIIPGMKQAIQCSLLCTQEHIECRKSAFELYGADFMLSEDMKPWLIEINSSPSMARNTHATEKLVDRVLDDMLKVVLDRKTDKMCDTGRFEMVYKQQPIADPPNSTVNLSIQGKKIRKKCFKK